MTTRREPTAFLLVLFCVICLGCKESRNDLNRSLISAGLPYFSDQDSKRIMFSGRELPVYFGDDQSEAAAGYARVCCSKEKIDDLEPLKVLSIAESGVYRTKITEDVYLLIGAAFDGIDIKSVQFDVYAKCSDHQFILAGLNHDELPTLYSDPMALCRATAL